MRSTTASKEQVYVAAVKQQPEATQLQLAKAVYGKATASNVQALQKLQSRVRSKLLNHLLFLDHTDPRLLVSRRYELECLDLLHKVSVLYAERDFRLAERLLLKCLKLAEEGEFTQYEVMAARMLRNLYAEVRRPTPHKKMSDVLARAQQRLTCEDEAEQLYAATQLAGNGSVAAQRSLLMVLPARIAQLESLHQRAASFTTYNMLYRVRIIYEQLRGDFSATIRIAAAADRQLQAGKLNARRFDVRLNHFTIIYACLRSRQPVRGVQLAERYLHDFHPTSNNWFYFQEHHMLLAMHAGRYALARQVIASVLANPGYLAQREAAKQRWDLYHAYIDFVLPPARLPSARQRQLNQQMLVLPEYSRDKSGHNVAILVLQLLYFLRERHLEEVLLRLERLRKYQQRHLAGAGTLRSRLFLRLLQMIVEKEFDATKAASRSRKLLQQLHDAAPPGGAFAEVEIIPYENLWEIVLDLLREGRPVVGQA
ncbi:MAG: hypothetical protein M3Y54_01480 [Bacteroidota bacterium]|nr:hypothetical protein [Bacteroidota bacterium]